MITKSEIYTTKFMAHNPMALDTVVNSKGQTCTYYEHPTMGDESTVYVMIDGILADTDFFDIDQLSDYEPILTKDGVILCSFEIL